MKINIVIGSLIFSGALHATTRTLDNNTARPADFRTIQEAVDGSQVGDVILIAGSEQSYGSIELSKRLTIKGPGYSFVENNISGGSDSAKISIVARSGADGSKLEGLELNLQDSSSPPFCNSLNITRCRGNGTFYLYGSLHSITRCNIQTIFVLGSQVSLSNSAFSGQFGISGSGNVVDHCLIGIPSAPGSLSFGVANTVTNSIITRNENTTYTAGYIGNCLVMGTGVLPAGNGNLSGGTLADVFVGPFNGSKIPGSEAAMQLKPASVAKGSGTLGSDMGIFGGATPYILSGIPAIPRIKTLTTPAIVPDSTGLIFKVEADARD